MKNSKVVVLFRPLSVIASEIRQNWKKSVSGTDLNYAAKPYLEAMESLDKITDRYICEDGKTQVIYFLSNASSWRGSKAKEIKDELKAMLK